MAGKSKKDIAVVVVHGEELMRTALRTVLERTSDVHVMCAAHDVDALTMQLRKLPDEVTVAVVQLRLPMDRLLDALHHLRRERAALQLVVLGPLTDHTVPPLVRAGVRAVLPPDVSCSELAQAVHTVAGGGLHPNAWMMGNVRQQGRPQVLDAERIRPTPREVEVLRLMYRADAPSCKVIAELCGLSERTIHTHRGHLLAKFGVASRQALLHRALELGFLP